MSSSIALRHARHLSIAAAASTTTSAAATTTSGITTSMAKSKLKAEFDPDKALEIYSSLSDHYTSPLFSRYAQDLTVKRLAKSRRFTDIEKLLEGHKNDPKITQEPYLSTLIRSYGLARMFHHALKTYHQMEELGTPRSTISFNALLSACIQSKQFDQVPKLFDEMPKRYGFSPNKVSYGVLVKSYCEAGLPESAISTVKEMEEKNIEITTITYTTIMSSLYKQGTSEEAERIWDEMVRKGCSPDAAAYNVRIMHASGGDPENVKGLIEEMSNSGLKPDTISYNYLMSCYCRAGKMDEAKKVYKELEENGCKPNAATFRTLIFHLCKNGRFEQGYKVFKKSVEVYKIPDFGTLQYLVRGLVEKKKIKDAKGMCRTVEKKFPSNILNAWTKLEEELGLTPKTSSASGERQESS